MNVYLRMFLPPPELSFVSVLCLFLLEGAAPDIPGKHTTDALPFVDLRYCGNIIEFVVPISRCLRIDIAVFAFVCGRM